MNLDIILEYQKIDQEIYKVETDLSRSKEMAKMNNIRNQLGLAEAALLKLNKETEDLFRAVESFEKDLSSIAPEKSIVESANTIEKIEAAEQALSAILDNINNIEKESKRAFDRLSAVGKEASKQYELGKYFNNEQKKARDEYNAVLAKIKVEHKQNFLRLNELTSQIDPKLLQRYKTLREHRRMPAIVPYVGGNCSACGMNISIEVGEKLINPGDIAECPNCRRMLYIK